ncbi:MAG: hypothetical protein U0744_17115 [Gemmataceae bacterium]
MLRRIAFLSLLFACGAFVAADELRGLAKNVTGKLQSINDTEIVLKADSGPVATPIAQTLAVDVAPIQPIAAGTVYTLIRLTDDGMLRCTAWSIKKATLEATLTTGVQISLPMTGVSQIVREANNGELLKKWEPISTQKVRMATASSSIATVSSIRSKAISATPTRTAKQSNSSVREPTPSASRSKNCMA